jgi:hypothetical protein
MIGLFPALDLKGLWFTMIILFILVHSYGIIIAFSSTHACSGRLAPGAFPDLCRPNILADTFHPGTELVHTGIPLL